MTGDKGILITVAVFFLIQLAGLTAAVLVDSYIDRPKRRIMLAIIAVVAGLTLHSWPVPLWEHARTLRTLSDIFAYCARPVVLALFLHIVDDRRSHRWAWALVAVNAAIHLTALFAPICFTITPDNHFIRGPLGYSCHAICGVLLAGLLYRSARAFTHARKAEMLIPIVNGLLIVAATVLDAAVEPFMHGPMPALGCAMVTSCVFYYVWLHLQFTRQHEQALMAEQRIQIMMSQIQPHFLYNALMAIQALCRVDPEKAFETTEKFGAYLRQNIESLSQPNLIPIRRELEHTRVYAEIEMIRFVNVRVEYDIADDDFSVPALTVQPLVENAIRHGVRGEAAGVVTVTTRRIDGFHEITIRDNGRGFDVRRPTPGDGAHIGIGNVRERLEKMCGGTLEIDSRMGEGTTVTVRVPE